MNSSAVSAPAGPTSPWSGELVADTPLRALLELAPKARAIVVGQRRRRATTDVAQLGSTSRGLVTSATCPVLVARTVATRGGRDSAGAVPARGD